MQPPSMALFQKDYFELKAIENKQEQEELFTSLCFPKNKV